MRETVRQDKESESKVADLKTVDSIVTGAAVRTFTRLAMAGECVRLDKESESKLADLNTVDSNVLAMRTLTRLAVAGECVRV